MIMEIDLPKVKETQSLYEYLKTNVYNVNTLHPQT